MFIVGSGLLGGDHWAALGRQLKALLAVLIGSIPMYFGLGRHAPGHAYCIDSRVILRQSIETGVIRWNIDTIDGFILLVFLFLLVTTCYCFCYYTYSCTHARSYSCSRQLYSLLLLSLLDRGCLSSSCLYFLT